MFYNKKGIDSWEADVLNYLDGHTKTVLTYMFLSFCLQLVPWIAIYARPVSSRVRAKVGLDPVNRSHRLERSTLATRVVSTIHASILSYGAIKHLFLDGTSSLNVANGPVFEDHADSMLPYFAFTGGFFIGDLMICAVLFKENGWQFVVHALCGGGATLYGSVTRQGHFYMSLISLWELSTPFLNFRWILIEYGMKDHLLYMINGVMLVITFTVCRILVGVPVLLMFVQDLHTDDRPSGLVLSGPMRWTFTGIACATGALNLMWGCKLWMGMFKTLGLIGGSAKRVADDERSDETADKIKRS